MTDNNWHVVEYYRFMCRFSAWRKRRLDQFWFYNQAMIEEFGEDWKV